MHPNLSFCGQSDFFRGDGPSPSPQDHVTPRFARLWNPKYATELLCGVVDYDATEVALDTTNTTSVSLQSAATKRHDPGTIMKGYSESLTLYGHITTAEQRTIMHQYGDRYTGRWWVGCYIWYSEERPGRAAANHPLLAVPSVTAHPSTASVPMSYH